MAEPLSNGQAQSLGAPSLGGSAEPLLPPAPSPVKNIEAAEMKAQPNSDEGVAGVASEVGVLGAPEEVKQSGNGPNEVQATVHTREADTGAEADAKREEAEEILIPLEVNTVQVPLHWHPKPCVHVTSIGGQMKEEMCRICLAWLFQLEAQAKSKHPDRMRSKQYMTRSRCKAGVLYNWRYGKKRVGFSK